MSYQSIHTGNDIDTGITNIQQIFDLIYPVGSYYMSSDSADPSTKFGGAWEQITDRMIMAAGSIYTVGATGGSATHTHTTAEHALTIDEMPKHRHTPSNYDTAGSESGYKRMFTTNLDVSSESGARRTVGGTGSGYAMTATTSSDITNTAYTSYQGNGASHSHGDTGSSSNLPPYIVAYIWKRTA